MLAVAVLAATGGMAASRGIRTCRCQLQNDLWQQGKLVGRICYVVGVGRCHNFTYTAEEDEEGGKAAPEETGSRDGRRLTGVLGRLSRRPQVTDVAATATPQQQQAAAGAARRRLQAERQLQQQLLTSGLGTVRPGSPSAVLNAEKGGDAKSQALGQRALAQIYYLQALLGRSRA